MTSTFTTTDFSGTEFGNPHSEWEAFDHTGNLNQKNNQNKPTDSYAPTMASIWIAVQPAFALLEGFMLSSLNKDNQNHTSFNDNPASNSSLPIVEEFTDPISETDQSFYNVASQFCSENKEILSITILLGLLCIGMWVQKDKEVTLLKGVTPGPLGTSKTVNLPNGKEITIETLSERRNPTPLSSNPYHMPYPSFPGQMPPHNPYGPVLHNPNSQYSYGSTR